MQALLVVSGWVLLIIVSALAFNVVWKIWAGDIDLEFLISETNGHASLSRFQFLIFTFVIAISFFLIVIGQKPPQFPAVFPPEVLILLGISGGSYVISKGIQKNGKKSKGSGGQQPGAASGAGGGQPPAAGGGQP